MMDRIAILMVAIKTATEAVVSSSSLSEVVFADLRDRHEDQYGMVNELAIMLLREAACELECGEEY